MKTSERKWSVLIRPVGATESVALRVSGRTQRIALSAAAKLQDGKLVAIVSDDFADEMTAAAVASQSDYDFSSIEAYIADRAVERATND